MTINDPVTTKDAARRQRREKATRFYNVRLSDRDAWFGALIAALFNALGMLLEIGIVRKTPGVSGRSAEVSALVGLLLMLVLLVRRRRPSVELASVVFLINTASVAAVLLITNLQFAEFQRNWVPFEATKLGCLVAAMLAPGFWVGFASILVYCLSALLQFQLFFPPEITHRAVAEPWPMIAFGLAGMLALVYRFRRAQLEQEIARIQAQNYAIKRLAYAFLNIRDLMNTPLQVIAMSIHLLRQAHDPHQDIIDRIDRSIQKLRDINSLLVQHEKEIEWQAKR